MSTPVCPRFSEDVVGLLDGTASADLQDHVASCDECRDRRHDFERASSAIAGAGGDFTLDRALAERLVALASETKPAVDPVEDRVSETRLRAEAAPPRRERHGLSRRTMSLIAAACASVALSSYVGLKLADRERSPDAAAARAWHGKVSKIVRSGADKNGGLFVVGATGRVALGEGAEVKPGVKLATDERTRARFELDDGSTIVLDRATEVRFTDSPRTMALDDGAALLDVAHVDGAPPAWVDTPNGRVKVIGTKLAVTATPDRTNVEVLRGEVELVTSADHETVSAGQEGVVDKAGAIDVAPANDLAQRAAFGEQLIATHNEDAEAPASGLGELRARRPGRTDEKDHAVRLAKHAVKIRIAGNVARTEIDETFANDTDAELEGIYRFPLPPGAQIERLALEVDGKLVSGEFVDKAKAAAIWRGAIQNAAPKAPRPREEIVWVPGPWHDPALLEWQRGGRFELRIFPIPKRGSRRVVIAYTETVAPTSGVRRYVYPLPQGSSSKITIGDFSVDAQIVGHDPKRDVRVRGYELAKKVEGSAERLSGTMNEFTPSGDLAIEYALSDDRSDATAWAYSAPPAASDTRDDKKKDADPVGDDAFVAIALRPKLPRWADTKPRDQVVVVDAGRAMFGERFARAKRLAVQLTQEMDRRDRITVLACDVACKQLPSGFVAPGAPSAHDVDAFLASLAPDGASDLVSAVRSAASASGRDKGRDLRVVVLSDGVATAGYRSGSRVAAEVADALDDPRGELVAVPIGADADTNLLGELARGGGGVVVPYQPGQRLEATALEVLNATYGTTLRDVELVLPDGLHDVAPATLPPVRAGSEAIVTARMTGGSVRGDVILRGKVGGDPFEAKYPIAVEAKTDDGNAFVPRLFAAARIADREREPGDYAKGELVALSRRFSVPSRFTSLLVLESEAMFRAFGIDRTTTTPAWTGETEASGVVVGGGGGGDEEKKARLLDASDPWSAAASFDGDESAADKKDPAPGLGAIGHGRGGGGTGAGFGGASTKPAPAPRRASRPAPAPTVAPPRSSPPPAKPAERAPLDDAFDARFRRGGGRFMKRVFVRHATIGVTSPSGTVSSEKIEKARADVAASPDAREKHKELARVLSLTGQLDELREVLEKWSSRDPLDSDVILARADLAARAGDRDESLRILGGALAASALSTREATVLAGNVARAYERLGRPEACAFSVAAAELSPSDATAVARAVACERARGRAPSAERWLAPRKEAERAAISRALAKIDPSKPEGSSGDVVVTATWEGGADLDLTVLDPHGWRAGIGSRMREVRVEGATSRDHETLALSSRSAGPFVVEIARASVTGGDAPVSGRVTVRALGQSKTIPFTLTGGRAPLIRVDVRWESELVPVATDPVGNPIVKGAGAFDRAAATRALDAVSVNHCGASGQVGTGQAQVTFAPSGAVSSVRVIDANFSGTPAGRCVQAAFFGARAPAFAGPPGTVAKTFTVGTPLAR